MTALAAIVGRDLRIALRRPGDALAVVAFYAIAAALFPLGVGPEPGLLARAAPGVVWATALLAAMLSLDRVFRADREDGTLDLLVVAPLPLWLSVHAKIWVHWLTTGLPLLAATPPVALALGLDASAHGALVAAMALGTAVVSCLGALGAALTLGARRGGVLAPVLVLPLLVPVLVFGASAVEAAVAGLAWMPPLAFLGGILIGCLVLCPWACAAALRAAVE